MSETPNTILWTATGLTIPQQLWNRLELLSFRVLIPETDEGLIDTIERIRPHLWVGRMNGNPETDLSAIEHVRSTFPGMPVILTSAKPSIEEATAAIRAGATEYLPEHVEEERLRTVLESVLQSAGADHSIRPAVPVRRHEPSKARPIAVNREMLGILDLASRIASSRSTILIQGESGTGKEVIARFIHRSGNRSSGPFVAVNCAALPENLLESELFGHEKGAFTGAVSRKKGKFELAHGGTLLLDEISEMAVSVQAKLLRVLQEREVDRVGGQAPVSVDVRVIATTNRDLTAEVREGNFRQDLFYRLNVVPFHLPPLRKRPEDIAPLADHFLKETASLNGLHPKGLSQNAVDRLQKMPWPGNVRELENLMERATLLVDSERIEPDDLAFVRRLGGGGENPPPDAAGEGVLPLREMEKRMIFRALDDHQGNRTRASKVLGISVRTLRNKLNEYQKEPEAYPAESEGR
ncbi:MAG: sigma-54 dependent transcriptional regulator [Desulfobacteraceae bacterium]|jgi:two-component system response regulator FlrC